MQREGPGRDPIAQRHDAIGLDGRASTRRLSKSTAPATPPSHQAEALERGVASAPDDQMVVDADPELVARLDDVARHRDVGLRRRWIAARMVVHH